MSSAAERLQPSRLDQRELLAGDVDLESLKLVFDGKSRLIRELIVDAEIERTIEGASELTLNLHDRDRTLLRKMHLGPNVDVRIDGLWFRLTTVAKSGSTLTLKFIDREVALLQAYPKPGARSNGWLVADASKTTRTRFAKRLVDEVKEVQIPFVCPALKTQRPIGAAKDRPNQASRDLERGFGFAPGAKIKVKKVAASQEQLDNIDRVLQVGVSMILPRKLLVCAVMTITQESTARNLTGGDRDSVGLFQQRPSQGWPASRDIERDARAFYDAAVKVYRGYPGILHERLCQAVQRSAYPDEYAQWRNEAEHTVTTWGVGATIPTADEAERAWHLRQINRTPDLDGSFAVEIPDPTAFFSRGRKITKGVREVFTRENNWAALQRLADAVEWRCFCVSGSVYFISEPDLFESRPRMRLTEDHPAVLSIDGDYNTGKRDATLRVSCRINRWAAPPGTVVEVAEMGVFDGRWLVETVRRSLFSATAEIELSKPRPVLPERLAPEYAQDGEGEEITGGLPGAQPDVGAYTAPLSTPLTDSTEFDVPDPEGAPDRFGVRRHAAKDWFAPYGSNVVAPTGGKIVEVRPTRGGSGQVFGGVVKLEQPNGYVWTFRHIDPAFLAVGAIVRRGDRIATVTQWLDNPGSSHAHIEVWRTLAGGYRYENMLDPVKFIRGQIA